MAVETTKSRRDRLSMGHLLEKKYAAGAGCADGAKTRGLGALFPPKTEAGAPSHRLERPVDLHLNEGGAAILEGMGDEIGGLVHGLGALRGNANRARQRYEIDLGIDN